MGCKNVLVTPFLRQCFVNLGVTMNVLCLGLIVGYPTILLSQLRETIYIEASAESLSWVASITGFSIILGAVIAPPIMSRKGRRMAFISGCLSSIIGWILLIAARNILTILIARFFHGICLGFGSVVAHVTIAEYTSPKNRGAFLVLHPVSMFFGSMLQHIIGVFLPWKEVAAISLAINIIAMLMVSFSPETPSFLATRGRFECCRKSFHWLRGHNEDDELETMIKAAMLLRADQRPESTSVFKLVQDKIRNITEGIRKKEFYKPVIMVLHLQLLNLWSGACLNDTYTREIFVELFGNFNEMYYLLWSLDGQRILTSALSMIVIRKLKRKIVLLVTVVLNIIAYISIAGYVYGKNINILPDWPIVAMFLLHLHYFSMASGCVLMPNIIGGEIYPLEYRGFCGLISSMSFSAYLILEIKTVPLLFEKIGIHGAYLIYAGVVTYSLIVLMRYLPETKDKTLLEIENEFKGTQEGNEATDKMIESNL